ncbi:hypothetical protein KAH94_04315 [bacterium]|nr:hypothetical protein [bacterium]
MDIKIIICTTVLFSTFFIQSTRDQNLQKSCVPIIESIKKEIISNLKNGISPEKIAVNLKKDILSVLESSEYLNTFKNKNHRAIIKKLQIFLNEQRKKNGLKIEKSKKNIQLIFKTCLENNPNKKKECFELKKVFAYFYTGVKQ